MKYSSYLNSQLILTSDKISDCVKIITDSIPNDINGWYSFFKNNHGHIVNNEQVTVAWASKIYEHAK